MLNMPSLEQWLEYMDSAITQVLIILDESMKEIREGCSKRLGINPGCTPRYVEAISAGLTPQTRRGNRWRTKYDFDDEDGGEVISYKDKDLGVPDC